MHVPNKAAGLDTRRLETAEKRACRIEKLSVRLRGIRRREPPRDSDVGNYFERVACDAERRCGEIAPVNESDWGGPQKF